MSGCLLPDCGRPVCLIDHPLYAPAATDVPISAPAAPENIICPNHESSKICGADDAPPSLCVHHAPHPPGDNLNKHEYLRIIEKPAYGSPDEAAMAAAIILYRLSRKNGDIEYGIDIYQRENMFYLTQTQEGRKPDLAGNPLARGSVALNNKPHTKDGRKNYSHIANVHSHPTNIGDASYEKFSVYDYCISNGMEVNHRGEISPTDNTPTLYLVLAAPQYLHKRPALMKFTPPEIRSHRIRLVYDYEKYVKAYKAYDANRSERNRQRFEESVNRLNRFKDRAAKGDPQFGRLEKTDLADSNGVVADIDNFTGIEWTIIDNNNRKVTVYINRRNVMDKNLYDEDMM
jgi:hypothetical protein